MKVASGNGGDVRFRSSVETKKVFRTASTVQRFRFHTRLGPSDTNSAV
jgi:hypothetical protein